MNLGMLPLKTDFFIYRHAFSRSSVWFPEYHNPFKVMDLWTKKAKNFRETPIKHRFD